MDQPKKPTRKYAPDEVNEYGDYIKIGGSPVPGLTLRQVLRGHAKTINSIAWSPDGKYLASPSNDKTIRIWDVSTGECVRVLEGHSEGCTSVAWSPNGQILASGGNPESEIRFWYIKTLKQSTKPSFEILCNPSSSLIWSPDGRKLASAGNASSLLVIDIQTQLILHKLNGYDNFTTNPVWSPNGHIVTCGSGNKTIPFMYSILPIDCYIPILSIASNINSRWTMDLNTAFPAPARMPLTRSLR